MKNETVKNKAIQSSKIRKVDLFKVFLRSFFVQSVWNYRNMISVGFESCLFPVVKRLYPDLTARKQFLKRHLKFFNGHPYMVSYALGVSIRLEEENSKGQQNACVQLDKLKELLISPLGALGDQLFWFTLKPVSLTVGALGIALFDTIGFKIGAISFAFLLYNIPHLYLRYIGIVEGYHHGLRISEFIQRERFEQLRKWYMYIGMAASLGLVLLFLKNFWEQGFYPLSFFLGAMLYAYVARKIIRNFYQTCVVTVIFFVFLALIIL